jgi:ubiquitin-protein ligase E3 A
MPQASRDALLAVARAELGAERMRERLVRPLQAHVSTHFRAVASGRGELLLAGAGPRALPPPPFRRPPLTSGYAFELAVRLLRVLAKACGANVGEAAAGAGAVGVGGTGGAGTGAAPVRLLPDAAFANADVSEMGDDMLRADFSRWMAQGFVRTVSSPIAVCGYAFLFTPAAKRRVVAIEAAHSMQVEASQAMQRNLGGMGLVGMGGLAALFGGVLGGGVGAPFGLGGESPFLALHVRRGFLLRDTLRQLTGLPPHELRKQLKVSFEGEDGVDQGGPTKELFALLVREIFDPKYGLWIEDAVTRTAWFHPSSVETEEAELLGMLIGLAVHNGVFLDLHFPRALYKALLGQPLAGLADLASVNPVLSESLGKLLAFEPAEEVEETFGLTFEATYEAFGEAVNAELCAGGASRAVTGANRAEYVAARCNFVLQKSVEQSLGAFQRGFNKLLAGPTLRLFSPEDLELLVVGETELDFHALQRVAQYDGGYSADSEAVRRFWRIVHEMAPALQKQLLHFVTGSTRAPIGGLGKVGAGDARAQRAARAARAAAEQALHERARLRACARAHAAPSLSRPYLPSQLPFRIQRNGVIEALPSASTCFK